MILRSVLLSVKPRYANALLSGTKTAEIRRRFPELPPGTVVFVYSSSPERRVIGTFVIRAIRRLPADRLWAAYPGQLSLTRQELRDYLRGCRQGVAIETADVARWLRPVSLSELRLWSGLDVPQSWRYLDDAQSAAIQVDPDLPVSSSLSLAASFQTSSSATRSELRAAS